MPIFHNLVRLVGSVLLLTCAAQQIVFAQPNATGAPYVFTQTADIQQKTNAILKGVLTPNQSAAKAWFEWGTNIDHLSPTEAMEAAPGTMLVPVRLPVNRVEAGIPYYYRMVASNAHGIAFGIVKTFGIGRSFFSRTVPQRSELPPFPMEVVSISGSANHTLLLLSDSTVLAFGTNDSGQLNTPVGLSNIVAISAIEQRSLALRNDGTLAFWGTFASSHSNALRTLSNVVSMAATDHRRVFVRDNGTIAIQSSGDPELKTYPGLTNIVEVAVGVWNTLALANDGQVFQLQNEQFTPLLGLTNIVAIAAGEAFGLALRSDGKLASSGSTPSGTSFISGTLSNSLCIAAGNQHAATVRRDGKLVAWGFTPYEPSTEYSQILNLRLQDNSIFAVVGNLAPLPVSKRVAGEVNQNLTITLTGTDPEGDGFRFLVTQPPQKGTLYQFSTSSPHGDPITNSTILVQDTQHRLIYVPQPNSFGFDYDAFKVRAFDSSATSAVATVQIRIHEKARAFTQPAFIDHQSQLFLNGSANALGTPASAWFEWGKTPAYGFRTQFELIGSGSNVVWVQHQVTNWPIKYLVHYRLVVSNAFGLAYGVDSLTGVSSNIVGGGEHPFTYPNWVPKDLGILKGVAQGYYDGMALLLDGTVRTWGYGVFPPPLGLSNVVQIAAGSGHAVALKEDGTLSAWGLEAAQATGPNGASNVVKIAADAFVTLALKRDGTVSAWDSQHNLSNLPNGLSNVVDIAAGFFHAMALLDDGRVVSWGSNYGGIFAPTNLENIVSLTANQTQSAALYGNGSFLTWRPHGDPGLDPNTNTVALRVGWDFVLASTIDGTIHERSWTYSQIGKGLSNVVAFAGGGRDSLFLVAAAPRPLNAYGFSFLSTPGNDVQLFFFGSDPDANPLTCRITKFPSFGDLFILDNWWSSTPLTNTNQIFALGSLVFYTPRQQTALPVNDTLEFVVSNGEDSSPPAIHTITIVPRPTIKALDIHPIAVRITFASFPSLDHHFLTSTNLEYWELLPGTLSYTSNLIHFTSGYLPASDQRYFKIQVVP
jgi:alpha-tubulin suppressor-like RCC1 family protein